MPRRWFEANQSARTNSPCIFFPALIVLTVGLGGAVQIVFIVL
jgi:hypothetical protein